MSWLADMMRKMLGIGARKAAEAAVDALQKRADSKPFPVVEPITDKELRRPPREPKGPR